MKTNLRISKIVWVVLIIVVSQELSAQFLFTNYSTNEGLVTNEVTCTFKDSRGFLWIGTTQGLQVYNGNYFRTLRHDLVDSNSISGDWIMSIAEDSKGMIWIGTDNGISKIHPGHLKCTRYLPGKKMRDDVKDEYSTLVADGRRTIWVLTTNYLMKLEEDSFICTDEVTYHGNLSIGNEDEILVVESNHVYIKNINSGKFQQINTGLDNNIHFTSIYRDHFGFYWIGSWGNGLFKFSRDWKSSWNFKWDVNPVNPGATNIISTVTGDKDNIFVASSNGLYVFNCSPKLEGPHFNNLIQHDVSKPHSLAGGNVNSVYIDSGDNIWVSTTSGLSVSLVLNREYSQFADGTGFATDVVWRNGRLITSSWYGKGVYFFDDHLSLNSTLQYVPEYKKELNNSQISGLDLDKNGNLWIASFNGLACYDAVNHKTIRYFSKEENGFATNRLNDVWVNEIDNEIWTANYDAGITRYSLLTNEVKNLNSTNSKLITSDLIWSFYDSGDGELWILTNSGVVTYNYLDKSWSSYTKIRSRDVDVPLGIAHAVLKDRNKILWLGTENGLFVYYHGQWIYKGIENGLPERSVNSIVQDQSGNIWIGFEHSIICYHWSTSSATVLSASNGILLPFIQFLFLNPETDQLFIASENSYYKVDKEKLLGIRTESPQIFLEQFNVNGRSYYSKTSEFIIEQSSFPYDQNNIEIGFITSSIGEVGKLRYRYRIGSEAWSTPSENNSIILPGLNPGNYIIEIKASTDGTHWSKQPLLLEFNIRPPFWATWWFRSIMLLMVLGVIIWWVRYLSTRKMRMKIIELEKVQAVERERSRLSRDMHDDLGSGLTKISILTEVVKKKVNSNQNAESYLEDISDSSRELVQNLNNIIWSLNTGNATAQALFAYIREYSSRFLDSCGVDVKFEADPFENDIIVSEQVKRNVFLVVKEVLNNAVKHGKAQMVHIGINKTGNRSIQIMITDNGHGFDTNLPSKGNGLKNMNKRMQEIGGNFILISKPAKGTSVQLNFEI